MHSNNLNLISSLLLLLGLPSITQAQNMGYAGDCLAIPEYSGTGSSDPIGNINALSGYFAGWDIYLNAATPGQGVYCDHTHLWAF